MHPHTKQWLDKFDDRYVKKTPYIELWREIKTQDEQIKEMKLFLVEALKSQAEYIKAEMVPRHKPLKAYNDDLRIGYNTALHEAKNNLDKLINSFK